MINEELFRYLVALNKYKTLSETANHLHISQPTLTRSMQKLEEELGVSLFYRTKNKLTFNDTGLLAVEYAQSILDSINEMRIQLKAFDRKNHILSIGSCAPAPLDYLTKKFKQTYKDKQIESHIEDLSLLVKGLKDHTYQLIIMPYISNDPFIDSQFIMNETLYFSLPLNHPLSHKKSLYLKEMDGEKMLLMNNIGFWNDMHKQTMQNTKFIIQDDRSIFYDLVELSSLPSFTSDYVINHETMPENRHIIPIIDEEAKASFYLWYLKENKDIFEKYII